MSYLSLFIMMSILFSDFCHLCWILYKLDDIQESFLAFELLYVEKVYHIAIIN